MTEQSSSDWLGLAGRVCVVTGAGGGIGRAVAFNLAGAGALGAPAAAVLVGAVGAGLLHRSSGLAGGVAMTV